MADKLCSVISSATDGFPRERGRVETKETPTMARELLLQDQKQTQPMWKLGTIVDTHLHKYYSGVRFEF